MRQALRFSAKLLEGAESPEDPVGVTPENPRVATPREGRAEARVGPGRAGGGHGRGSRWQTPSAG